MLKTKYILLILILLLTFTLIGDCDWLPGWDQRIELAIGDYAGDIGAEVVWFPVTIFLKDANGDSTKIFEEIGNNYRRMAITKNDGTTELKGEIEGWNYDAGTPANSTGFIHTSADGWTINANTSVWIYYDNDHADNANIDVINTVPGAAVWNSNFTFVCHMVDDTTSTVKDSTSNNNDGTKTGANEPIEAAGKVGLGQTFDATNDKIDIGTGANPTTNDFTLEAIVKTGDVLCYILANREVPSPYSGFHFRVDNSSNALKCQLNDGSNYHEYSGSGTANDGNWHYVALVVDHTNDLGHFYLDGAVDVGNIDISAVSGGDITSTNSIWIGCDEADQTFRVKSLDELRISNIVRSAAWEKGTHNSLWDSLLTYGSEETVPVVTNVMFMFSDF